MAVIEKRRVAAHGHRVYLGGQTAGFRQGEPLLMPVDHAEALADAGVALVDPDQQPAVSGQPPGEAAGHVAS